MARDSSASALLRLVPSTAEDALPSQWFCGHCGSPPPNNEMPAPPARVCGECNLGLLLEARADIVPDARRAVRDRRQARLPSARCPRPARACSRSSETDVINRPITELLTPADAEASGPASLAGAIMGAAGGEDEVRRLMVRPANVFGVRMPLRVGACGPPRAALIVLED